jgi:hypothetical protein
LAQRVDFHLNLHGSEFSQQYTYFITTSKESLVIMLLILSTVDVEKCEKILENKHSFFLNSCIRKVLKVTIFHALMIITTCNKPR